MKPDEKEIEWGLVDSDVFDDILRRSSRSMSLMSNRISFSNFLMKMEVTYDNPVYRDLLAEKFSVMGDGFLQELPRMYFLQYQEAFGFKLPFRNFGFVDNANQSRVIVFAPSFGVFKSVISGFASFRYESDDYYPIHASVMSVDGKGVAFIGGSMAGKTTTLINIAQRMREKGRNIQILADDWCMVKWQGAGKGLVAETFDPSVSFRKRDLDENPHIVFPCHDWLLQQFQARDKISLPPSVLYGSNSNTNAVKIDYLVLMEPFPGPCILRQEMDEVIARKIIHAAYHYPYVTDVQRDRHVAFWCDMQKRVETYCFNTRSESGGQQMLDPIEGVLI